MAELGYGGRNGPWLSDFDISGGVLCVTSAWAWHPHSDGELRLYTLHDPSTPTLAGRLPLRRGDSRIAVSGGYVYVATPTEFQVIDISNPTSPQRVGGCSTGRAINRVIAVELSGDYAFVNFDNEGFLIFRITELPAITRQTIQNGKLNLQWNEPARGMRLQRATSLTNADWQDIQDSEAMIGIELPVEGGQEYFRLVKP